jgi:hypothetical protein
MQIYFKKSLYDGIGKINIEEEGESTEGDSRMFFFNGYFHE